MKMENEASLTATISEWRKIREVLIYEGLDITKDPTTKRFLDLLGELDNQ